MEPSSEQQPPPRDWLPGQVRAYRRIRPLFEVYADTLAQVLREAVAKLAPMAIVETRAKTIASFAEKCQRKWPKYRDPVNQLTDLCGGRVITHTPAEVAAVCRFIEDHFVIDRENSVDITSRLDPAQFGYRSIHYVVQCKPGALPCADVSTGIPRALYPRADRPNPMKAEIQVRTLLEHAWASFSHERVYKGAFDIPEAYKRQLAVLAAMLEEADESFVRIQGHLQRYAAGYDAYMSKERMQEELERLRLVQDLGGRRPRAPLSQAAHPSPPGAGGLEPRIPVIEKQRRARRRARQADAEGARLAHRIARLAITLSQWQTAIDALQPFADEGYQPLLRDLGVALCKRHPDDPHGDAYLRGQEYLRRACTGEQRDPDALCSLAGTYKKQGRLDQAWDWYRRAYEMDPSYPYAVSNYLVASIVRRADAEPVRLLRPAIEQAAARCREQALVNLNLPWAYFDLGMFHLLLGEPTQSLAAYAKAVQLSHEDWFVKTSLETLEQLEPVQNALKGYPWIRRLLLVGLAAKFGKAEALAQIRALVTPGAGPIRLPVAIVAGGTDPGVEETVRGYRQMILDAFHGFGGTIISGGTPAGIAGLVGEVQMHYGQAVHTIGYLPRTNPHGVEPDGRYGDLRVTDGEDFSALETVQYWIDLVAAGVDPRSVRVLGVNGGPISAAEFRLALALGARVAVVEGSGREAARLLKDPEWMHAEGLICIPVDGPTAAAFLNPAPAVLDGGLRQSLAQAAHHIYRELETLRLANEEPSLRPWPELEEAHKEARRGLADQIAEGMSRLGYVLAPASGQGVTPKDEEFDTLARWEHGWWVAAQLQAGWMWGKESSTENKTSPYLIPWERLPAEVQAWTRDLVRGLPAHLEAHGLEIRPQP